MNRKKQKKNQYYNNKYKNRIKYISHKFSNWNNNYLKSSKKDKKIRNLEIKLKCYRNNCMKWSRIVNNISYRLRNFSNNYRV